MTRKARTTDPATSHAAAEEIRMKAESDRARLLLAHYDDWKAQTWLQSGLMDEQAAVAAGIPLDSEYATRCSELRKWDPPLLVQVGEDIGRTGRRRIVCRLTKAGKAFVETAGWR